MPAYSIHMSAYSRMHVNMYFLFQAMISGQNVVILGEHGLFAARPRRAFIPHREASTVPALSGGGASRVRGGLSGKKIWCPSCIFATCVAT
jgi:hypothetical protein